MQITELTLTWRSKLYQQGHVEVNKHEKIGVTYVPQIWPTAHHYFSHFPLSWIKMCELFVGPEHT